MSFKAGKVVKGKADPNKGLPSLSQEEFYKLMALVI